MKAQLVYSKGHKKSNIVLLELPEYLVRDLEYENFVFKGSMNDNVLMCTKNNLFIVREAPSSNSILLVNALPFENETLEIAATVNKHWCLECTSTNIDHLKKLVCHHPLDLIEERSKLADIHGILKDEKTVFFSTQELLNVMQTNESELLNTLKRINAFEYKGKWRTLSEKSQLEILQELVNLVTSEGWDFNYIDTESILKRMSGEFPTEVVQHVLSICCTKNSGEEFGKTVALNKDIFCQCIARMLLIETPIWMLDEFLNAWRRALPYDFVPDLEQLETLAIVQNFGKVKKIIYLPADRLPYNPKERLNELFKVKPKWRSAEISPYLKDLIQSNLTGEQILVTYARVIVEEDNTKTYSSK